MLHRKQRNFYCIGKHIRKIILGSILFILVTNAMMVGSQIPLNSKPDLTISTITIDGDLVEGEEIRFETTIANIKDVDITTAFSVALFYNYSWSEPIDVVTISDGLEGNGETTVNLSWMATIAGSFTFSVYVDYQNIIDEDDENNNVWDIPLEISERITDLTFLESTPIITGKRQTGQTLTIAATATNTGSNTTKSVRISLYKNESQVDTMVLSGLDKDETRLISFNWIPENVGTYNISLKIDANDTIDEQDEDNNRIWQVISIDIAGLPWWNENWHYRKFYDCSGEGNLTITLNFTQILSNLGVDNQSFENETIHIVIYNHSGEFFDTVDLFFFNESTSYHPQTNAKGNLTWYVNASKYYCLYFDVASNPGTRFSVGETPHLNTSGQEPSIIYESLADGWTMDLITPLKSYYLLKETMIITVSTSALAHAVQALFYRNGTYNHTINLSSINYLNWTTTTFFSSGGNWSVVLVANDTAGYHAFNLSHEFFVGVPDLILHNITLSSSIPSSLPFYKGYPISVSYTHLTLPTN